MSEKHNHEDHIDEVNGMKQGHGKVPRFLIIVYAALACWAVFYALTAKGIDETKPANAATGVSADAGKTLMGTNCALCHGQNFKGGMGPTLAGVVDAKGEEYVIGMMKNGGVTMPAIAKQNNWNDDQVKSVIEAMKTIK
jgi:cytochrome c550